MKHVYVMRSDSGLTKVGVAINPMSRLKDISYASGLRIVLEHASEKLENARAVEAAAHRLLSGKRRAGEWFDVTPQQAISAIEEAIVIVESEEKDFRTVVVRLHPTHMKKLDDLRRAEADLPTRPQMVRRLIHDADSKLKDRKARK